MNGVSKKKKAKGDRDSADEGDSIGDKSFDDYDDDDDDDVPSIVRKKAMFFAIVCSLIRPLCPP